MLENDDIESNIKVIDFDTSIILKSYSRMNEIIGTV